MSVIDNKGRLFGLINIIDLTVVLVVALIAFGAFTRMNANQNIGAGAAQQDLEIVLLLPEVMKFATESFQVGDQLVSTVGGGAIGQVADIKVEPLGRLMSVSGEGRVSGEGQLRYNVYLTVQAKGDVTNSGVRLGGEKLFIGDVVFVQSHISKARVVLTQVEVK